MDEGWATTFEYLFNRVDMGAAAADKFYEQFRINGWAHDPSPLEDLPIITPEDMLKNQAYGNNAYGKPSLGYLAVKELLGDSLFKKALHEYMDRWHGKHPTPWDFFYTFNDASGKDLDWFWNNWFFSDGYIDLAVRAVTRTRTGYTVQVDNIGGFDAPFDLRVRYTDGTGTTIHESPAFWQSNAAHGTIALATSRAVRSVTLDGGIFVDADSTNNVWNAK
jgi:aminopeptidase N